jgi:hypothetical protein
MFQPKFQGQEHADIAKVDEAMQAIVLDLRIMQRAAPADMPRRRAKIRAQLVEVAERVMTLADEFAQ